MRGTLLRLTLSATLTATLVAAAVGCSGPPAAPPAAAPTPTPSAAPSTPATVASSTPTPTPTPTGTAAPPALAPLALAVHPARRGVGVDLATARALVAGRVRTWADLGRAAAPLRLVDASRPGTAATPAQALAAVEADPDTLALVPARVLRPGVVAVAVDGVDPLRTPGRYPLRTTGAAPPQPVTLSVVGDIMLGRRVGATGRPGQELAPLAGRLARADVTIGNLESTLSRDGEPTQGGDSFAADPAVLGPLRAAGFDVLSLANNHVGDFGARALVQTIERLRAGRITPVGAGADAAEAARPVVLNRHGVRIGVLAFNAIGETPIARAGTPGAVAVRMPPRTGPLNQADLNRLLRAVRDLDAQVDVVVVLPHWGTQYTHEPEAVQRTVARALGRAGADLVVGGHPHWVQGVERMGGALVVHSLGNFVFDMDFMTETQQGVVLETVLWGERVMDARLVPYRMDSSFAPRLAQAAEAREILADVRSTSRPPFSVPPRA